MHIRYIIVVPLLLFVVLLAGCGDDAYCSAGQSWCWAKCVDLQSDNENCGACDNRCALGGFCENGKCRSNPVCGEPEQGACPQECQTVRAFWYSYECRCGSPLGPSVAFCRSPDQRCDGPHQLVQSPNGVCKVLDQGCENELPPGWIPGCCELPDVPAPELSSWACEGCTSDNDCSGEPNRPLCGSCGECWPTSCDITPSSEFTIPCGGESCQVGPCPSEQQPDATGGVCILPWWATDLEPSEEGLGYIVGGQTHTTWDDIVNFYGRCTSAYYLIGARSLLVEGYVTEAPPSRVCMYPIDCGIEECGIETTFCCTDLSAGGSTSCKAYDEVLPAMNGVTVDLDQRICTLP
jgi:hypothetical protein